MAKPGYRVKIAIKSEDTDYTDAAIDVIQAALTAFDANISFTDETIGGKKVSFYYDLDYVDFQSPYGNTVMALTIAFNHTYVLVPTIQAIEI